MTVTNAISSAERAANLCSCSAVVVLSYIIRKGVYSVLPIVFVIQNNNIHYKMRVYCQFERHMQHLLCDKINN